MLIVNRKLWICNHAKNKQTQSEQIIKFCSNFLKVGLHFFFKFVCYWVFFLIILKQNITCPEAVEVSGEDRMERKVCLAIVERPQRSILNSTADDMTDCL